MISTPLGQVVGAALARLVFLAVADTLDRDPLEQPVRGGVAECAGVLEQNQLPGGHLAARRRTVVVEHLFERRP